jgi:hypothetical protein
VVVTHAIEEAAHLGQFILVLGTHPTASLRSFKPMLWPLRLDEDPEYRTLLRELRARLAEDAPFGPPGLGSVKRAEILLALLVLLLLWQGLSDGCCKGPSCPHLWQVDATWERESARDCCCSIFLASLWRVMASLALSIALAAPAGLVLGQSPALNRLFSPLIYLTYPIPKVVLVPAGAALFGNWRPGKRLSLFS